jgi:hypothetical protein
MHCISLIIIKKSELRANKINLILDESPNIKSPNLNLGQDFLAFPNLSKSDIHKHFGSGITFAHVETDYFGGCGEQHASLFESTKNGFKLIHKGKDDNDNPINEILKLYGVIRNQNMDEFDTINLGSYRTNKDMLYEISKSELTKMIIKNTKSF